MRDGSALVLQIDYQFSKGIDKPFNLDLGVLANLVGGGVGDALKGVTGLVDANASAKLHVEAKARLLLGIGVDLEDPLHPSPFILDSTGITLQAKALGTALNFTAALGPLGIFVKKIGRAHV